MRFNQTEMLSNTRGKFDKITYRKLDAEELKRLDEVLFYITIKQMYDSRAIKSLPVGTTVPKLLAGLLNVNTDVIDYAFRSLQLSTNTPTSTEVVLLLKEKGVSAARSMYTPTTYYRGIKKWKLDGEPALERRLSDIQHVYIKKFNTRYGNAFLGKRGSIGHLHA